MEVNRFKGIKKQTNRQTHILHPKIKICLYQNVFSLPDLSLVLDDRHVLEVWRELQELGQDIHSEDDNLQLKRIIFFQEESLNLQSLDLK